MLNPVGLFLLAFGLAGVLWPYELARFGERLDTIGSKRRWRAVEPADWNVVLTRSIGISLSIIGAFVAIVF